MSASLRKAALSITPPVIADLARRIRDESRKTGRQEWRLGSDTDAEWTMEGWMHPSIVDVQCGWWDALRASTTRPNHLGTWPGGGADAGLQGMVLAFGYALSRAADRRGSISVLDWGGGLGQYYLYARELYPNLRIDYTIKELPAFCAAGAERLPDVRFLSDADDALSRRYDFVFASGSIHYTRDLYPLLRRLARSAHGWLMITRLPCIAHHEDFVVVQRPYRHGYETEYPCWFVNRAKLIDFVSGPCGLELEREFLLPERPFVPNAPEQCAYSGFLFRRDASAS